MHTIWINGKERTSLCGELEWTSNAETLGVQLTFDLAFYEEKELAAVGDIVQLKENGTTIFTGVVVTIEIDGRNPRRIKAFDFAFYLNKSEVIIQFNTTIDAAIRELCSRFKVKCNVATIPIKVKKIYKDEKVSDVIKDLLAMAKQKTGKTYRFEMRNDTLVVEKQTNLLVKGIVTQVFNPQRSLSLENMCNSIIIVSDKNNVSKVVAAAQDEQSVRKYGLLQMVESIDAKNVAQAKTTALQLLKQFNKVTETGAIELNGNSTVRAGRLLQIKEPVTGLVGTYTIKSVTHTSNSAAHLMKVTLEAI